MVMASLLFVTLLAPYIVLSDIAWFKDTQYHQDNIAQLTNGWVDCPGWSPSDTIQEIELTTIFGPSTTIKLPPIKNEEYNFTARCITIQVPLNWDDSSSITTIDYHLAHIFSSNNVNNIDENGAFWMLNGGPGGSGQELYGTSIPWLSYIDATYNMYIPDHRGTGLSNPLECIREIPASDDFIDECVEYINQTDGNDIHYFSTYAASMDLGYTIDLFLENLTFYVLDDTIIYGISYGTYYLNTYLTIFPDQVNAVILDGICPPDRCRIINYDENVNKIGLDFTGLCGDNAFCKKQFNNDDPLGAMEKLFMEMNEGDAEVLKCIDNYTPTILKQILFRLLADFYLRILIPPVIYRMDRCNENDKNALNNMMSKLWISNISNISSISTIMLGYNIILSEMWNGLNYSDYGLTYDELVDLDNTYYVSAGTSVSVRKWWEPWNRYKPNENIYGQFADPPIPMLLLNGDLDPQTPDYWAIYSAQQYGASIDDDTPNQQNRYYYTVPNTPHFVMFRSPMINTTEHDEITGDNLETCGFWIMKSFINNDNWLPDSKCVNWIQSIDFEGNTNISKSWSMDIFGIDDVWEIEEDDDGDTNAIIWVILIGCIIILIEMALFAYCDYKKQTNQYDDDEPLLETPKKEVDYSERW